MPTKLRFTDPLLCAYLCQSQHKAHSTFAYGNTPYPIWCFRLHFPLRGEGTPTCNRQNALRLLLCSIVVVLISTSHRLQTLLRIFHPIAFGNSYRLLRGCSLIESRESRYSSYCGNYSLLESRVAVKPLYPKGSRLFRCFATKGSN